MAAFLGSCTRYRVFVGEAYMPPGKGAPHAGFAGNHPFPLVCRAGVHARRTRSAANTCFAHLPVVPVRFVGAACMRPVGVCLVDTFFLHRRVHLICRGGIHAARQGCCSTRGSRENLTFPPVCRAGVHARRTDNKF